MVSIVPWWTCEPTHSLAARENLVNHRAKTWSNVPAASSLAFLIVCFFLGYCPILPPQEQAEERIQSRAEKIRRRPTFKADRVG